MADALTGKVAVITGGATGIGKAVATRLAAAGAKVVIAGRDHIRGKTSAYDLAKQGYEVKFLRTDVRIENAISALFEQAIDLYGGLDYLFNNAGIEGVLGPIGASSEEIVDDVLSINVKGVFLCMKQVLPLFDQAGGRDHRQHLVVRRHGFAVPGRGPAGSDPGRGDQHDPVRRRRLREREHQGLRGLSLAHRYPHGRPAHASPGRGEEPARGDEPQRQGRNPRGCRQRGPGHVRRRPETSSRATPSWSTTAAPPRRSGRCRREARSTPTLEIGFPGNLPQGIQRPDLDCPVLARRGDVLAVGSDGQVEDHVAVGGDWT